MKPTKRIVWIMLVNCAVVLTASAADPVPNVFVDDTVIVAGEVNANFQALVDQIVALETTIAAQAGQITALETNDATQDTTITAMETDIATLQTYNTTLAGQVADLETNDATQDTTITAQGTQLTALETNDTVQDTNITSLETNDATQDTNIGSLETNDTTQDSQIAAAETRLDQGTRTVVQSIATGNATEVSGGVRWPIAQITAGTTGYPILLVEDDATGARNTFTVLVPCRVTVAVDSSGSTNGDIAILIDGSRVMTQQVYTTGARISSSVVLKLATDQVITFFGNVATVAVVYIVAEAELPL